MCRGYSLSRDSFQVRFLADLLLLTFCLVLFALLVGGLECVVAKARAEGLIDEVVWWVSWHGGRGMRS